MNRGNWFLVIPTIVFGIWASWALYQMHAAGDARRAVEIVGEYRAEGQPTLAEFLGGRGPVACSSAVVSNFYGTMDVTCRVGASRPRTYVWRVDVLQQNFAPADDATRALMAEYQPTLFDGLPDAGATGAAGRGNPDGSNSAAPRDPEVPRDSDIPGGADTPRGSDAPGASSRPAGGRP